MLLLLLLLLPFFLLSSFLCKAQVNTSAVICFLSFFLSLFLPIATDMLSFPFLFHRLKKQKRKNNKVNEVYEVNGVMWCVYVCVCV